MTPTSASVSRTVIFTCACGICLLLAGRQRGLLIGMYGHEIG
jgi:hypothetical protein